jgi:hypothetical protein
MKIAALFALLVASACGETAILIEVHQSPGDMELDTLRFVFVVQSGNNVNPLPLEDAPIDRSLVKDPYTYLLHPGSVPNELVYVGVMGIRNDSPVEFGELSNGVEFVSHKVLRYRIDLQQGSPPYYGGCWTIAGITFPIDGKSPCTTPPDQPLATGACSNLTPPATTGINQSPDLGAVFCDMNTDGGGWTLAGTFVNGDGIGHWNDLSSLIGESTFGQLAIGSVGDYRSPAFHRLAAQDLLVRTGEYGFSFHGLLAGETLASFIGHRWPVECSHNFLRAGADFDSGLTDAQKAAASVVLHGANAQTSDCFTEDPNTAALCFFTSDSGCHGVARVAPDGTPASTGALPLIGLPSGAPMQQPLSDHNVEALQSLNVVPCQNGYPCNNLKFRGGQTCVDASCTTQYVMLLVR